LLDEYEKEKLESRSLANELKLLNQEHERMKQVCDTFKSECESSAGLQSQVKTLRHEITSLRESNSSLVIQLADSHRELAPLREEHASLLHKHDLEIRHAAEKQTRREDLAALESKYESLVEAYEREKQGSENLANKLAAQVEEIESLRAEYQTLKASYDSLHQVCESLAECILDEGKAATASKK